MKNTLENAKEFLKSTMAFKEEEINDRVAQTLIEWIEIQAKTCRIFRETNLVLCPYDNEKEISLESAKKLIDDFPNEDEYIRSRFINGVDGYGEYWDNTIETSNYWNAAKKIAENV